MKHFLMRGFLVLAISLVGAVGSATEFLIKYKNSEALNELYRKSQVRSTGLTMVDHHQAGSYVVMDIPANRLIEHMMSLTSDPNIEWVIENFKIKAFEAPAPLVSLREQWSIAKIQAERAWQRAGNRGRRSVIIGVIDTGIDYNHPNLMPNMVPGYDFRNNDSDPMDETSSKNPGHGTHCAGIAAGSGLIENGVVGMSAEVSVMPIRFLGSDGSGDLNGGIKSIDYAIEKGVQVISASWGATIARSQATALIEAVKRADDRGVIFVAAAANDGRSNDTTDVFPANSGFPNTITVAASGAMDAKPSWSNFGKKTVHLSAPGEKIMSTLPGNKYDNLSGTSMATPLVSGLVAFLKAQDPTLTGAEIRALLQTTGVQVAIETACNCRIDAYNATDHLLSKKAWLVPTATTLPMGQTITVKMKNGVAPFEFTSSNTSVLTVDNNGLVTPVAQGTAKITAKDANGVTLTSMDYNVGTTGGGGGGGGGGECPFEDPQYCEILCGIYPDLPFCN